MNDRLHIKQKLNLTACTNTSQFHQERAEKKELQGLENIPLPSMKDLDVIFATIELKDLNIGKNFLNIKHTRNHQARHKPYYSTSITNLSTEKIRIDRFATYVYINKVLVLHSLTGGFFSLQQFQEWYDLRQSPWLEPGQVVTDPNNHSNLDVYWAYFGTTASGQTFTAGSPWRGSKHWWRLW
jgi:hypothetical protein